MLSADSPGTPSPRPVPRTRLCLGLTGIALLLLAVAGVGALALQRSGQAWLRLVEPTGGGELATDVVAVLAEQRIYIGVIGLLTLLSLALLLFIGWRIVRKGHSTIDPAYPESFDGFGSDTVPQPCVERGDELGRMQQSVALMQDRLRHVVGHLRDHLRDHPHAAPGTVAAPQADGAAGAAKGGHVAPGADPNIDPLPAVVAAARRGGEVVTKVVGQLEQMSASSRRMGEIIGAIDAIAFQTNMLALNAAVAAAGAGDQGKGVAAVATEVGSLAQRAASAAREIKTLINASLERADAGNTLVRDTSATMDGIVTSVQRITEIVRQSSVAAADRRGEPGGAGQQIAELDALIRQHNVLGQQSASAAEALRMQAERLQKVVSAFELLQQTQEAAWAAHTTISSARRSAASATMPMPLDDLFPTLAPKPQPGPDGNNPSQSRRDPRSGPTDQGNWEQF